MSPAAVQPLPLPAVPAEGTDHPAQKPAKPVLLEYPSKNPPEAKQIRADSEKKRLPGFGQHSPALRPDRSETRFRWKILCSQWYAICWKGSAVNLPQVPRATADEGILLTANGRGSRV